MDMIEKFVLRLKKIGIDVTLSGNYPWIYLESVNGKRVTERFVGNHGFTAFFYSRKVTFSDRRKVFQKIREML